MLTQGKARKAGKAALSAAVRRKQPSQATMERWMFNGVAKATDGCRVEPDGVCPHGKQSWLIHMGVI